METGAVTDGAFTISYQGIGDASFFSEGNDKNADPACKKYHLRIKILEENWNQYYT
ncbi:MAG: hypothetical protein OEY25_11185 [Candidatus Aminicenantes bacterium]|nr:hypothetical protein [Candidatus Aminicenantes bacterium]MDH5707010.1 hypothetical protein [Candidatus Aminicenantes bacterium]